MTVEKGKVLYSGKAKTLYETNDPDLLISEFRDDTTAFDGVKHEKLMGKGKVNHAISNFIMQALAKENIPTHCVSVLSATESVVKKLTMIPVECIVRNRAAGGLCRRLGIEAGLILDPPFTEFFLKSDELHDPLISIEHAERFGYASVAQLHEMRALTLKINAVLVPLLAKAKLLLIDAKFEFGVGSDGLIYLADEISPDSCRIWDQDTLEILDKDRFRKDLGQVVESYQIIAERLGIN